MNPTKLREQATSLEMAARRLREAADLLEMSTKSSTPLDIRVRPGHRIKQVLDYLREHGPARDSEIRHGCGIPIGSMSAVFRNRNLFTHDGNGLWRLTDEASSAAAVGGEGVPGGRSNSATDD